MKPVCQVLRSVTGVIDRPHRDVLGLLSTFVETRYVTFAVRVNDGRVARVRNDESAFSAAGRIPVLPADCSFISPAGDRQARVVLLSAINTVWKVIVDRDMIKLRGRLVVQGAPGLAAVVRDAGAAVVRVDQARRVVAINPQTVMVSVRAGRRLKVRPPSVERKRPVFRR